MCLFILTHLKIQAVCQLARDQQKVFLIPTVHLNQFMTEVMFLDVLARDEPFHEPTRIMEDTPSEESSYQWKVSSMASTINNMDQHIMSLQEEMRRLNNITNPFLREVLVSAVAGTIKNNSTAFKKNSKKSRRFHNSLTRFRFGTIISQTQTVKHSMTIDDENSTQYETKTSFIFYPASWLMSIGFKYGIEATATNSNTGWQFHILSVRAVQDDSLIFRFCESGNVDAVRELFEGGHASVVDINSDGWRPLHVSNIIYFYPNSFMTTLVVNCGL
jgi:hypothetical protein